MKARENYATRVEKRLDEMEARIVQLAEKADQAEAGAKEEYRKRLEMLQAQRDQVRGRLRELRAVGASAWRELESGITNAMAELRESLDRASDELQNR